MCGRFTNRLTWREIVALYRLTVPATPERNLPARYNICPTQTIDAVIERGGKRGSGLSVSMGGLTHCVVWVGHESGVMAANCEPLHRESAVKMSFFGVT